MVIGNAQQRTRKHSPCHNISSDIVLSFVIPSSRLLLSVMSHVLFAMHGDSSLYLKSASKNKSSMFGDLAHALGVATTSLHFRAIGGARVPQITQSILDGPSCNVMGISIFGNGLTGEVDQRTLAADVASLCAAVRAKSNASVFFIGGYASKYGYCNAYDENCVRN